jgi:nicotinamidase-related amidase
MAATGRTLAALDARAVHLCIDMQNLLGPESPWHAPWAAGVLPNVTRIAEAHAGRTIFTRFVPPADPEALPGTWRRYYRRWDRLTARKIDPHLIELLPPLKALVPPAAVIDKPVYSPFTGRRLKAMLRARAIETLVVTGAETDICVLATVLAAVDLGYRVVVAEDAVCGSADSTHDALLTFYRDRLSLQVELADTGAILAAWSSA